MQEVEKYREYAADCRRLAERASDGDKKVLMMIAEAWEQQAKFAQANGRKREA
jgi:hypothetical protein